MNLLWSRFLKSTYRKEPISSFILTVGAVDAVIGSVGQRWTLLSFGLLVILIAALLRWWQVQKAQAILAEELARELLPPSQSQPPLPRLKSSKQRK